MTGFDILKARKETGVSQTELAQALGLKGGRGSLTDVENCIVEADDEWIANAVATVLQISETKREHVA
jgi:transcriptional regulator with XRE-family HTH domain